MKSLLFCETHSYFSLIWFTEASSSDYNHWNYQMKNSSRTRFFWELRQKMERTYAHLDDGELRDVSHFFSSVEYCLLLRKTFPPDTCAVGMLFRALCCSHTGDVSIRIKDNPLLRLANKLLPNRVRKKNEPTEKHIEHE